MRDLSSLVPPTQLVDTENLTTLLVVVSKQARGEWLSQYESLSEYVVPRSSSVVAEDQDYQAFTVVLFRRVVDNFKTAARGKGFQVSLTRVHSARPCAAGWGAECGTARRRGVECHPSAFKHAVCLQMVLCSVMAAAVHEW